MPDRPSINQRVKQAIVRALHLQILPEEIPGEEALFGGGMEIDSVATLEILFALEEEFDIEVDDDDLRVELFASVDALVDYVEARLEETVSEPV